MICLSLLSFNYILTTSSYLDADGKKFKPDIRVVHVRDLNFVLKSEIFVHYDGQLRASYLILVCTPVYTSYQPPKQALTVDSPLLCYIDVRLQGFFPLRLTVSEALDLGHWLVRVGSLVPVRDESADSVFQGHVVHTSFEEPRVKVQLADQVEVKSVDSLGAEAKNLEDEMVVPQNITDDRFLPGSRPPMQQQQA